MNTEKQHRLGQHYSNKARLIERYTETLKANSQKIMVDPFCGQGHLITHYLNLFSYEEQIKLIQGGMIRGFDICEDNINDIIERLYRTYQIDKTHLKTLFQSRDSFLDTSLPDNSFIITNPPYLAKNVCQKKFRADFDKYFTHRFKQFHDYFEISLNLYQQCNGIWITPANLFSAENMKPLRATLLHKLNDITIFRTKTFDHTDISVCTFLIDNYTNSNDKRIKFIDEHTEEEILFNTDKGEMVAEWQAIIDTKNTMKVRQGLIREKIEKGTEQIIVINEQYKPETIFVSPEQKQTLLENVLILRTTDTGSANGMIGLYTMDELYSEENALSLLTKTSSRVYVPIFFENTCIAKQLKIKDNFNKKLNELREKYNSIFLTNYKNVSGQIQRKRISFKSAFSLINHIHSGQIKEHCNVWL